MMRSWAILVVIIALGAVLTRARGEQPDARLWTRVERFAGEVEGAEAWVHPARGARFQLDDRAFADAMSRVALEGTPQAANGGTVIVLPMPDGTTTRFRVLEAPVMEPALQARFPQMRTYVGRGLDLDQASVRLSWTPRGLQAQILCPSGTAYVDPYVRDDRRYYTSYFAREYGVARPPWACGVQGDAGGDDDLPGVRSGTPRVGDTRRVYRLAVAATAEYTALHGGTTGAMNDIVTLVNNLNGVYEIEANIRFTLVANNNLLIYTDALTDPYTNTDNSTMLGENQSAVDTVIGTANYDIGHVFGTANGGVASIGVVCFTGQKARGVSASPFATTDPYTVQTFCHEVGHQFNARHTFNGVNVSCTVAQRSNSDAYEPGSGSTLMSYSSFCGTDNLQSSYGDLYLNAQSFDRIANWAAGHSCGTPEATGNTAPSVDAGLDYTIPAFTPFVLAGSGADPDGVTFCWEQRDLGPAQALSAGDTGSGPIIRSRPATASPSRSIPTLADLLAGTTSPGEITPTTSRTLTFRLTARDNHAGAGGVSIDDMAVQVVGTAGPFQITSPNTNVSWTPGTQTVTWDVAGTTAAPISCAEVRILLSTDGGATFPVTLASNAPNNGSASVVIPSGATTQARIRIEAVGNIFFDVSNANFTIPCTPPTGVAATDDQCDAVHVSWDAVPGASSYNVWRGATNSPGLASLLGPSATATYDDTTGTTGTTYFYFVSTVAPSCTSGLSTPDQGTRTPLGPVAGVSATISLCGSVDVSWTAYSGATGYQVRRNTVDSIIGASLISSPGGTTCSDASATPGQTYFYFVRAQTSACGFSPYAPSVQGVRKALPGTPTGVTAGDMASCAQVDVSWTAAANAASYEVLRNTIDDALTASIVGTPSGTTFSDTTVAAGIPHYYFVRGVNPCGSGGVSTSDLGSRGQAIAFWLQPVQASVCAGENAEFSVAASGSAPVTYQWFLGPDPVGDGTATLSLAAVSLADNGKLVRCDVTNSCGMVSSDSVPLHVRVCGPVIYVDQGAPAPGNGADWTSAFHELRDALAYAASQPSVTTIKVAAGIYMPSGSGDRDASFVISAGVSVLGGYPTGGGVDAARDAKLHPTILSGDLGADDGPSYLNRGENARRVVVCGAAGAVLDGLIVRSGFADGPPPADSGGGVRVNAGASLTLRDCRLRDNEAIGAGGGLIALGAVVIERCSIEENRASQGGGVALDGTAQLLNSTLSGNIATSTISGEGGGGLLVRSGADVDLRHCTIAGNSAPTSEGGGMLRTGGLLRTDFTIISDNASTVSPDVAGDLGSMGYNLVRHATGVIGSSVTDLLGVDPRLEPLADNSGATPTRALGLYSRAIDAAPEPCVSAEDQRGVARPVAGILGGPALCDIGAYEAPGSPPICPADADDGSMTGYPDGGVDINDLLYFLEEFEQGDVRADLDDGSGTGTRDQGVDINDLLYFLLHFDGGC